MQVLIVDDNLIMAKSLEKTLKSISSDFTIQYASNGVEALDVYRLKNFDLIFMDIYMPIMDGITATQRIVSEFPEQKVIAFTTKPPEELKEQHELEKLFSDYLLKPTMKPELEILLNRYIQELNQKSLS